MASSRAATRSRFTATLLRPDAPGPDAGWVFLVLPKSASARLPRRGRTSVEGTINGCPFQATLEPDGKRSHWLKVDRALRVSSGAQAGDTVTVDIAAVLEEPEPAVPPDFKKMLQDSPRARVVWEETTTIARVDWIHWMESAKQAKTRATRVKDAVDMLASGKARVCCFDPSGVYSKGLCSPPVLADDRPRALRPGVLVDESGNPRHSVVKGAARRRSR